MAPLPPPSEALDPSHTLALNAVLKLPSPLRVKIAERNVQRVRVTAPTAAAGRKNFPVQIALHASLKAEESGQEDFGQENLEGGVAVVDASSPTVDSQRRSVKHPLGASEALDPSQIGELIFVDRPFGSIHPSFLH